MLHLPPSQVLFRFCHEPNVAPFQEQRRLLSPPRGTTEDQMTVSLCYSSQSHLGGSLSGGGQVVVVVGGQVGQMEPFPVSSRCAGLGDKRHSSAVSL